MHERDPLGRGAALFDAGEHFAAHEVWEARWRVSQDPGERRLLQGLIQVAAAYYKLFVQGKPASAARLLSRGLDKLDACPASAGGLELAGFRAATRADLAALAAGRLEPTAFVKLRAAD